MILTWTSIDVPQLYESTSDSDIRAVKRVLRSLDYKVSQWNNREQAEQFLLQPQQEPNNAEG